MGSFRGVVDVLRKLLLILTNCGTRHGYHFMFLDKRCFCKFCTTLSMINREHTSKTVVQVEHLKSVSVL